MHTHAPEVVAEACFHEVTDVGIERLAMSPQHFIHDWRGSLYIRSRSKTLDAAFSLKSIVVLGQFPGRQRLALQRRFFHPHDLLSNTVGFLLVLVPRQADGQLGLNPPRHCRIYPHAAEVVAEARFHVGARGAVQRLAGGAQHIVDDGRDRRGLSMARRPPL